MQSRRRRHEKLKDTPGADFAEIYVTFFIRPPIEQRMIDIDILRTIVVSDNPKLTATVIPSVKTILHFVEYRRSYLKPRLAGA